MFLCKRSQPAKAKKIVYPLNFDLEQMSGEDLAESFNIEKDGNGIKTVYKINTNNFGTPARQGIISKDDLFYVMTDKGLCVVLENYSEIMLNAYATDVSGCYYRENVLISAKDLGTYMVYLNIATKVSDDGFSSMTSCADRVFGLDKDRVRYTAAGKYDGWEEGESITLPSECNAIVAIGEKVYALGNDCYVITPQADDVEFKVTSLAKNIGTVSRMSVQNYNNRVIFGSSKGLYQLCSDKITRIFTCLNDTVDLSASAAALFNGKYYLSCRTKSGSSSTNDVTLGLNLDEEKIVGLLQYGYESMGKTDTRVYGVCNGVSRNFIFNPMYSKFVKSNIDLSHFGKKYLDWMSIRTLRELDVTIRSETETRLYKLEGKNSVQKINLRDMGCKFSIELFSQRGIFVSDLLIFAHVSEEV